MRNIGAATIAVTLTRIECEQKQVFNYNAGFANKSKKQTSTATMKAATKTAAAATIKKALFFY